MSPPCTPYRSIPSRRISSTHARAVRAIVQPVAESGVENAYPGSDGTTTSNAGPLSGRVSRSMSPVNSATELGKPCVSTSVRASGCPERTWMKWIVCPSISVVNCGYAFSPASWARQSNPVRQ